MFSRPFEFEALGFYVGVLPKSTYPLLGFGFMLHGSLSPDNIIVRVFY